MIRRLVISSSLALAGCAAPVVTRIDAVVPATIPRSASFVLAPVPDDIAPVHRQATTMITTALQQRGWSEREAGEYLLAVTLADRMASATLKAGDDAGKAQAVIAAAADRTTNRGCARRDHRLTVRLTHRVTGEALYAGSAAEFHCKATLDNSLPYLVSAALDGLDGQPGVRQVKRKGLR